MLTHILLAMTLFTMTFLLPMKKPTVKLAELLIVNKSEGTESTVDIRVRAPMTRLLPQPHSAPLSGESHSEI